MKRIYNTALVFLFFLLATTLQAQNFQGKAFYKSKTTVDLDNWGGNQFSEQQKKQIMERMKSALEKSYVLTFTQAESIYKEEEALETPGQGGGFRMMMSAAGGDGNLYKNVKENILLQEKEFFGKQFLVNDTLPKLTWKMEGETKQIGQYTCFKATAVKSVNEFDWRSMRRRNNTSEEKKENQKATDSTSKDPMDEIEIPEEIVITAWYTPQIPVSNGPADYWGLPGLILEVNADRTTILCTKIVMNPEEKEEIKKPSKGKEVTLQEYNETIKQKIEEMREMYGGRNGGRRF
ncbi:MAG TPA: GLPGLI family protein [Flavobacteriaceae bacterium]|nr:GLPGLI family protein [Flavobacteriaceae bacterium]